MKYLTIAFVLLPVLAFGQSISNIAGTISDDEVVTITGTGFGARADTVMAWDTFENGTVGEYIGGEDAIIGTWSSRPNQYEDYRISWCKYGNESPHNGDQVAKIHNETYSNYVLFESEPVIEKLYLDWWTRAVPFTTGSYNWKTFNLTDDANSRRQTQYVLILCNEAVSFPIPDGPGGGCAESVPIPATFNYVPYETWRHLQLEWSDETSFGAEDGHIKMWQNGTLVANYTGSMRCEGSTRLMHFVHVGEFWGRSAVGDCAENPGAYIYLDNVYMARSWARVMLGDDHDFSQCSHTEVQIPTAWSATEITATINTGSFADQDSAWVFVVTEAGAVSPGHGIEISSVYDGDPDPDNLAPGLPTITRGAGSAVTISWTAAIVDGVAPDHHILELMLDDVLSTVAVGDVETYDLQVSDSVEIRARAVAVNSTGLIRHSSSAWKYSAGS